VASLPRHYHSNYAVAFHAPRAHRHNVFASLHGVKRHFASLKRNVRFG
jgi:hypothetical protein